MVDVSDKGILAVSIVALIGVLLIPILSSAAEAPGVSGTTLTILILVPLIFAIGILIATIKFIG